MKGKSKSDTHKQAVSEGMKRYWESLTPEEQEKIREQGREGLRNVDQEKRIAAARKAHSGVPRKPSVRKKISESHKGIRPSVETRAKQSQARIEYFNDNPEAREHLREIRLSQSMPQRNTSIEVALQNALTNLGIDFVTHHPLLGICKPDIIIRGKIVVQADGDYWHSIPEVRKRDSRQDEALRKAGYIILRFSGTQIKEDAQACAFQVLQSIQERSRENEDTNF